MDFYVVLKSGTTFGGFWSDLEDAKQSLINAYKKSLGNGTNVTFNPTVGGKVVIATVTNGDSWTIRQMGAHRTVTAGMEGM